MKTRWKGNVTTRVWTRIRFLLETRTWVVTLPFERVLMAADWKFWTFDHIFEKYVKIYTEAMFFIPQLHFDCLNDHHEKNELKNELKKPRSWLAW